MDKPEDIQERSIQHRLTEAERRVDRLEAKRREATMAERLDKLEADVAELKRKSMAADQDRKGEISEGR